MVKKIKFKNQTFSKKELKQVIYDAFTNYGIARASELADEMKELGFHYATQAGISISVEDLKIPPSKRGLLEASQNEILESDLAYARGEVTSVERFQKVIDTWNNTSETLKNNVVDYFGKTDPLNSIYLMAFSGARGNLSQVRQLVGMRGLMSDPNGQIIDIPIIHNFREGLTITDYIMSAYGARKGVVDTALRTADSGYLTRRLIDVAQDVIIREPDCGTKRSLKIYYKGNKKNFIEKILGRTSAEDIYSKDFNNIIVKRNEQITTEIADQLIDANIKSINLRSPLTCESTRSICQKCYGWNLSHGRLVDLGEAVGIISAQSIGEPGTQLTMRTFHTGGIFTADPSRQIRAKKTGFLKFNSNLQIKPSRTIYGSNIDLLERETSFTILDYQKKMVEIKLPADSSLFIKDKSFVKAGDLLAELPLKNQQTTQARKNISASHSGEIILQKNLNIAWILEGELYDIPSNSFVNNFEINQKTEKQDNLAYFKIISKNEGILNIERNKINNQVEGFKILNCLSLFKLPVYLDKKKDSFVLVTEQNTRYIIQKLPKKLKENIFLFANQAEVKYRTETGGQIFYPKRKDFLQQNPKFKTETIVKNGKILFVPQETHIINRDKSLLLVPNKTKLENIGTELINDVFSKTNGFLETKESNQILQEITIKPGEFFEYKKLSEDEIQEIQKLNQKIYFPGEVIFDDILISYLTLIEIVEIRNSYGIILRPIQEFNIAKPNSKELEQTLNQTNTAKRIKFNTVSSLTSKSNSKTKKKESFDLIESSVWIENLDELEDTKTGFVYKLVPDDNNSNLHNLAFMKEEALNISNFLSKKLVDEKLKLTLCAKNYQYVEPQTIIGLISTVPKINLEIDQIKKTDDRNQQILLTGKENYQVYDNNGSFFYPKKGDMVKVGDKISPLLKINCSGKVIEVNSNTLKIHKGTPFFLTEGTKVYKKSGNFIKKEELLGTITFEQIVTGDIVQGLPKIEEILEARKPQNPALLSENPGIIRKINNSKLDKISTIEMLGNANSNNPYSTQKPTITYTLNRKKTGKTIIVKKNDFIYVGQPLTEGSVNPHTLLVTYFNYYKNFGSDYEAAYQSFKNVQLLLIQKVQQVYNSQGVDIADKHLEIIIKRITSKVQISKTGGSFLLPGELVELRQIQYINEVLAKSNKVLASYQPILLGITKASLVTDSFISAASFQETTKILTSAAIEGKIDWLRGLKENVIIGRLIPVGTGFRPNTNV